MKNGLFITGTGTGVGKTVVSAMICKRLCSAGYGTAFYKPVQTGASGKTAPDCDFVQKVTADQVSIENTYLFKLPSSPHLAAEKAKTNISISRIRMDHAKLSKAHDFVIVEGAGGLSVPLNRKGALIADIPVALRINTVIVSAAGLGAINHVCLTAGFSKIRGINVSAVILVCGGIKPSEIERDNCRILKQTLKLESVFLVPYIKGICTSRMKIGHRDEAMKSFPEAKEIRKWINP